MACPDVLNTLTSLDAPGWVSSMLENKHMLMELLYKLFVLPYSINESSLLRSEAVSTLSILSYFRPRKWCAVSSIMLQTEISGRKILAFRPCQSSHLFPRNDYFKIDLKSPRSGSSVESKVMVICRHCETY